MKGIEEVENAAMLKYGGGSKIAEPLILRGLIFRELELSLWRSSSAFAWDCFSLPL